MTNRIMKKIITTCLILFLPSLLVFIGGKELYLGKLGGSIFAQLSGITYQAVAVDQDGKGIPGMDLSGQSIPDASISVRFTILENSISGNVVYQETHTTNTDAYGLFSLVIGAGSVSAGTTLAAIPWQNATQFLKVEIDIKNNGNYKLVSIQQLMAVPYAFYAAKSDTALYSLNAAATASSSGSIDTVIAGDLTPLFSTSVTNPDSAPAFTFTLINAAPTTVFGNNSGSSGQPSYFSPQLASSLFQNQGTATTVLHGDAAGNPAWNQIANSDIANGTIDLAAKVTGVLPVVNGGTNTSSIGSAGTVVYSTGSSYNFSPSGTAGQVLVSGGTAVPSWSNPAGIITINGIAPVSADSVNPTAYSISIDSNTALTAGVVLPGSGNPNKVWKTDAFGNPGWQNVDTAQYAYTTAYADTAAFAFSANAWGLNGNTGLAASNFIGTIDSISFNVRVNNQPSGRIDPGLDNAFWGYKAGAISTSGYLNTAVGEEALAANTTGWGNTVLGAQALYSSVNSIGTVAIGTQALYSNTTGSGNVAVGAKALFSNTLGISNVAVGALALYSNTFGSGNSAIGDSSLYFNTIGLGNIAIGPLALYSNIDGDGNMAIGPFTLNKNSTGNRNIAVGDSSLFNNTSGSDNIALGGTALFNNTSGIQNIALGNGALYSNTLGFSNTAVGVSALRLNNTGNYNAAVGHSALANNTAGSYNTAMGLQSLNKNTIGDNNTATGAQALYSNTAGSFNTASGGSALYSNTSGGFNSAHGFQALYSNTTGFNNSAYGFNALYSNNTGLANTAVGDSSLMDNDGSFNTAIGVSSLRYNTIGIYNTAGGVGALYFNNIGNYNTAFGGGALGFNFSGAENTAMGGGALYKNTIGSYNVAGGNNALKQNISGSSNVAIGVYALENNLTGSQNTALGYKAFNDGFAFSNSTAIGHKAQITANNMVQLGDTNVTMVQTSGMMKAGGYTTAFVSKSTNYTLTALDDIVAASGNITITLPNATTIPGRKYTIKNVGVLTVTVDGNGAQTIDGATNRALTLQYQYVTVVSDGTGWLITANN